MKKLIKVITKEFVGLNCMNVDSRMYNEDMTPIITKNLHNGGEFHLGMISSSLGWAKQDISYERWKEYLDIVFPEANGEFEFQFEFVPYEEPIEAGVLMTVDVAILAKRKGFTLGTAQYIGGESYNYYDDDGTDGTIGWGHLNQDKPAKAPQSVLQKWLREVCLVDIIPPLKYSDGYRCSVVVGDKQAHSTYEEALNEELILQLNQLTDSVTSTFG